MRASASALAAAPLAPLFTAAMADAAGTLRSGGADIPVYRGEFWTAKQRQATPIHEVSYRACFKPQLPAYFISRLTAPGDTVYDPFSGRGTTAIEAALHGRRIVANDVNPLSAIFTRPRLAPPALDAVAARLAEIDLDTAPPSLRPISRCFSTREQCAKSARCARTCSAGTRLTHEDAADRWIRMVATNRLTGHSKGFFSVYTLPPNQAASAQNQLRINSTRGQAPEYRDTRALILKKSRQLQGRLDERARTKPAGCRGGRAVHDRTRGIDAADSRCFSTADGDVAAVSRRRSIRAGQLAALLVQRSRCRGDCRRHYDVADGRRMGPAHGAAFSPSFTA